MNFLSLIRLFSITAVVFILFCHNVNATPDRVKEAASKFMKLKFDENNRKNSAPISSDTELSLIYSSNDTCRNRLYGYNSNTGGYVFAVELEDTIIVTAYSLSGRYESGTANIQMSGLIKAYESSEILKTSMPLRNIRKGSLSPLLETEYINWNQTGFYNKACPVDPSTGQNAVTGCVATAMAQILRYHKYPAQGRGSHTYQHPYYGTISADFGATEYDWNNMPGVLTADNEDVAKVLFHAGVSVDMNYGLSESSANVANVPLALSEYFGYKDARYFNSDYFAWGTNDYHLALIEELENDRPVFYELRGDPGHAVVIDGYDGDYFHINFGWGGSENGYFLLSGTQFASVYQFGFRGNSVMSISPLRIATNVQDSLTLVAFYNATNGQAWKVNTNWLTGKLSSWHGVDVLNGRVRHLILTDNNLTGTIPPEIGKLTGLTYLNLAINNLTGEIPEQIGLLTNLMDLTLSLNKLTGTIPESIGNLHNLRMLSLAINKLTGNIPETLGNIPSLSILNLTQNQLNGSIPASICNLQSLSSLELSENQLSGPLPAYLGNLTNLSFLNIEKNNFSGNLPATISGLTKLTGFMINDNKFEGYVPAGIGNMTLLKSLKLDNNLLTSIPDEIGLLVSLERFTADNNKLSGNLPDGIGNLTNLKYLSLNNNQIKGIPQSIGNLKKLEYLSLSLNQINAIPIELGGLASVQEIYFSGNKLSSLPFEISQLPKTVTLVLDHNYLEELTPGISLMKKLIFLDVAANRLNKPLPPLSHINFYNLNLSNNNLSFEDIAASGFLSFDPSSFLYFKQRNLRLTDTIFTFVKGDSLIVDIREISEANHLKNSYKWIRNGSEISDSAVLRLFNPGTADQGYYYCIIENELWPGLTIKSDSLYVRMVNSDNLSNDTISSKRGTTLTVADKKITLVKPANVRGILTWQASKDTVNWINLTSGISDPVMNNITKITADSIIIQPVTPALYRFMLKEGECKPLYSDTIKVMLSKSTALLDTILNVSSSPAEIKLPEIVLTIPTGISGSDFRLTIDRIETPPAAPDSVITGNVYDVKLSCGTSFSIPIKIKLKIASDSLRANTINRFRAAFFDEEKYLWTLYDKSSVSLDDSTLVFETDHLTKLAYWERSLVDGDYTDKFVKDGVTVYYKKKLLDLMGLYDKNQTTQNWHVPTGDPEFGTPLQVQDMAHFTGEVMAKFRTLGLQVPDEISIYADNIDDYGVVGLLGMTNGYLTLSIYIDDPVLLRSVVAHEYMHFTQDYYISAHPGNIFWMEANGHLADRIVWDSTIVPVCESDHYLLDNRGSSNSIFQFLSKSWDYWDASILTQNLAGNVDFCYQAGTFIHFMRSYKPGIKLKPDVLLKETSLLGSWKDYLDSYIKNNLGSTINDQYADYIKFIFSGKEPDFTVLNTNSEDSGDPLKFILQASSDFSRKHLIKLPEDQASIPIQNEDLSVDMEPLSAQMEHFYNMSQNRSLCIRYVRKHTDTASVKVYLCRFNNSSKTMEMTDISRTDSSHFFVLAASDENLKEKSNQAFLLFINKNGNDKITAEYQLEITPVTDFSYLYTFWFGNDAGTESYDHKYNDGTDRRIYFWVSDNASRSKVYTDSSFIITEQRANGVMELYYNFRNGNMSITENKAGTYGYYDVNTNTTETISYTGSTTVELKNIFFAPLSESLVNQGAGIYDFHSKNSLDTKNLIISISDTYTATCTSCPGSPVTESYTYTSTDWNTDPGIRLNIQVK
ncbi:MAG TPA: C10 family peptidase [Bacteroidales bacterium]|nr:C10 family peptidase [Bacteroidales bacterium]